jgi:hypothetical protein
MKTLTTLLALALFCATGYGQTIKSLGYNTNGQVVYSGTNTLTFTNAVAATEFKSGTNFSALQIDNPANGFFRFVTTNTNDGNLMLQSFTNGVEHKSVVLGVRGDDAFIQSASTNVRAEGPGGVLVNLRADTIVLDDPATTRTNLGLGGGITTNVVVGTNTLVFTNGILLEVQ